MSSVVDIAQSFKHKAGDYFSRRNTYTHVHCLLLWWKQNDLRPEKEVRDLAELLREGFHYGVSTFEIPVDGSQKSAIKDEIFATVKKHGKEDSLLIIYYSGHCDPDEHGHARWAA